MRTVSFVFLAALAAVLVGCDNASPEDEPTVQLTQSDLQGRWAVVQFVDENGARSEYPNLRMDVSGSSIEVSTASGGSVGTGSFDIYSADTDGDGKPSVIVDMVFSGGAILDDLVEEWIVTDYNLGTSTVEFLERVSNSKPEVLRLRKESSAD